VFTLAVPSERDYVRMFEKKQHVRDRTILPRFDNPVLEITRASVRHETQVHYPAVFFGLIHEPWNAFPLHVKIKC